jgi:hypothetical protein
MKREREKKVNNVLRRMPNKWIFSSDYHANIEAFRWVEREIQTGLRLKIKSIENLLMACLNSLVYGCTRERNSSFAFDFELPFHA